MFTTLFCPTITQHTTHHTQLSLSALAIQPITRSKRRLSQCGQAYANNKSLHGLRQGLNGLSGSYWSTLGLAPVKCCLMVVNGDSDMSTTLQLYFKLSSLKKLTNQHFDLHIYMVRVEGGG